MRVVVCALALALAPLAASARQPGPWLDACRAHGEREIRRDSAAIRAVVFDQDRHLIHERHSAKIGSQAVRSILWGNGAIVYPKGPPIEMSFLCLLADEKRPLFFFWTPRRDAPALAQCGRAAGVRAEIGACLDLLLQTAESDLTQAYALQFQEARERDSGQPSEDATSAFRKAADAWRSYRDAECARRAGLPANAKGAAEARKACIVELTRRRLLDLL